MIKTTLAWIAALGFTAVPSFAASLRSVSGAIRHDTPKARVSVALPNCFGYWDLKGAACDAPPYGFSKMAGRPVSLEERKEVAKFSFCVSRFPCTATAAHELGSWRRTLPDRAGARIKFEILFTNNHADLGRLWVQMRRGSKAKLGSVHSFQDHHGAVTLRT